MSALYARALAALASALVFVQLFVPPILGLADNGDYIKLSGHACIGPQDPGNHPYFDYFESRYTVDSSRCGSIIATSAELPLFLSAGLARIFLPHGQFDLRLLGVCYAIAFLGALWFLLRLLAQSTPVAREVTTAAAVLIFCTAVYIPWLNTFYIDAASFIYLLWAVLLGISLLSAPAVGWLPYAGFTAAALLLATSKLQYAPLPLCLIPILWWRQGRTIFPAAWIRAASTAALLLAILLFARTASPWYQAIAVYDGLFFKFLPATADPAKEIAQLGLPPEFDKYVGQHAYSDGTHMQQQDYAVAFGKIVTMPKLARFLLSHPKADLQALRHDLGEASLERVRMKIGDQEFRLGNYQQSAGKGPNAQSHFLAIWSRAKLAIYGDRPLIFFGYILVVAGALLAAALYQPDERARALGGALMLIAMLPAAFLPPFIDAVDTGRHLFLFNGLLDLCVCSAVWLALRGYYLRRRAPRTIGATPSAVAAR